MRYTIIYGLAKECSCELKPGIKIVKETVKSVVGSVHEKFRLVPDAILHQIDTNQDHSCTRHHTPVSQCEHVSSTWPKMKQSPVFHWVGNMVAPNTVYLRSSTTERLSAQQRRVARPECTCLWCMQTRVARPECTCLWSIQRNLKHE